MKYKTAKVIGHPRSGSHYLAQLLNINFFHLPTYLPLYAGHGEHHRKHLNSKNTAVFYIYRNNEDSIKSMFVMRNRLGLIAKDLEEFKKTKLSNMCSTNIKSEAVRNVPGQKEYINIVDTYLGQFKLTPEEYLNRHKNYWIDIIKPNYLKISYDDLLADFPNMIKYIAEFLDSEKTEFIKETERIGWYDRNEVKKILT